MWLEIAEVFGELLFGNFLAWEIPVRCGRARVAHLNAFLSVGVWWDGMVSSQMRVRKKSTPIRLPHNP